MTLKEEIVKQVVLTGKAFRDDIVNNYPTLQENDAYEAFTKYLREVTGERWSVRYKNDDYHFYEIIKEQKIKG